MSWATMNEIIALAMIDQRFCQQLLDDPLTAISTHGFHLMPDEQKIFSEIKAQDIYEFSRQVLEKVKPEDL